MESCHSKGENMNKFDTESFEDLCKFVGVLLKNEYQVSIRIDCGGVYMVEYCAPFDWDGDRFALLNENKNTVDGLKVSFVE